jgi:hypothetical protein
VEETGNEATENQPMVEIDIEVLRSLRRATQHICNELNTHRGGMTQRQVAAFAERMAQALRFLSMAVEAAEKMERRGRAAAKQADKGREDTS